MGNIESITEANFDEKVLKSDVPVLVDFWAEWCGPCKMLAPILDQVADSFGDSLRIVKVNIDHAPSLAQKYEVMSIPTVKVFKEGKDVRTEVGVKPLPFWEKELKGILG